MTTNRLVMALVLLTLLLQGALLYKRQFENQPPKRVDAVRDAPTGTTFDLTGVPVQGSTNAKVVIIEFSDYECPFCAQHANGVEVDLRKEYVTTGKIRYAYANNPLPVHPAATLLATAAICAGEQGLYWEMHDRLFIEQPKTVSDVSKISKSMKLDNSKFQDCIDQSDKPEKVIARDRAKAKDLQLMGTPSFVIAQVTQDGQLKVTKLVLGTLPLERFETIINEALGDKSVQLIPSKS
jgi:protein-disulfide isomerase